MRLAVADPVGKNKRLMPANGRMIRTLEARAFMDAVALQALAARNASSWPRNVFAPKRVRLTVDVFNTKHDAAAVSPLVADALEAVLYHNDRIVIYGPQCLPIKDGGERRVEIAAELLERYSDEEAMQRMREFQVRSMKKLLKKGNQ